MAYAGQREIVISIIRACLSLYAAVLFAMGLPAAAQSTADFYAAPGGSDTAPGTLSAPFATLDHARAAVQLLKQSNPARTTPIVVMLRGGTYYLPSTLAFTAADSGTSTSGIVYQAYPGETPVVSGGRQIAGLAETTPGTWVATMPQSFTNFEQLYVNGERRYRPRTTKTGYLYNAGPVYVSSQTDMCSLEFTGKGFMCFDRVYFKPGDFQASYHNLNDVEFLNFENWDVSRLRIQSIDTANNIVYFTGSTGRDGSTTELFWGFKAGHRYLLENVKEALSQAGEWYLDRAQTPWTLTYLAMPGETIATATAVAPQLSQLLTATGLQYVTFRGLTFAHDNFVVPAAGYASAQGEPKVTAAVSFEMSSFITIDACIFAHTAGHGLEFVGAGAPQGAPTNQIVNSEFYDLGTNGIKIGAVQQSSDTDANVAQNTLIENNVIAGGGRFITAGMGIWTGDVHNTTITHNDVYDFYETGIMVDIPTPGTSLYAHDNVTSFNHVYQIGQGVASDMGGIYYATYNGAGNKILNNRIHDVTHDYQDSDGYGGNGIYLDNGTSGVTVKNNLVYRISGAGYMNHMGTNNIALNNVIAYPYEAAIQRGTTPADGLSSSFTNNVVSFLQAIQLKNFWTCGTAAPVPCPQAFFFDSNLYWSTEGKAPTFMTDAFGKPSSATTYSWTEWQALGEDVHSINQNPLFVNPTYPADDFSLQAASPASKIGFQAFDPAQAGRSNPVLFPPILPPAYPLQLLDPIKDYGQLPTTGGPSRRRRFHSN
jgi:hypothetical protein